MNNSMKDRRHSHQPHYRKSAEHEHLVSMCVTLVVGAMLGASIALGFGGLI